MQQTDLYSVLKIGKEASLKEIKKAYRSLSKVHHPDKGGDEEVFKEISEAYRILSNASLREAYDNGGIVEATSKQDEILSRFFVFLERGLNSHKFSPDHVDLFKLVRAEVNEKDLILDKDLEKTESLIRNLEGIKKRLINADLAEVYLNKKIDTNKKQIDEIKDEKDYLVGVLSLMESMEYEFEEDEDNSYRQTSEEFLWS